MSSGLFNRCALVLAILVLGSLAYYGLDRRISNTANPCVETPASQSCVDYACNIGRILALDKSAVCAQPASRKR